MPIGAIATSGRISAAFAYITVFFTFILAWYVIVFAIEIFANVIAATIIETVAGFVNIQVVVPTLDLPTPTELLEDALGYFPQLYNIGNTILWGFFELIFFGLAVVFGIPGALMGPGSPFNRVKDRMKEFSSDAGNRRREKQS